MATFEILYGEGISYIGEIIDLGVEHGFIKKSGAWYSYGEERIGQGKENVRQYLKEHPEIVEEVDQALRAKLLDKPTQQEEGLEVEQEALEA